MKYELVYTRRAVKDIQKLDADNKERIGKKSINGKCHLGKLCRE